MQLLALMDAWGDRHEGPKTIEDGTIITEEEFETKSRENVERWIQAHIVPVRLFISLRSPSLMHPLTFSNRSQLYPIKLLPTSQFETLLEGVVITVDEGRDWTGDYPEGVAVWKHIVLNKNITIVNEIEVCAISKLRSLTTINLLIM